MYGTSSSSLNTNVLMPSDMQTPQSLLAKLGINGINHVASILNNPSVSNAKHSGSQRKILHTVHMP